MNAFIEIQEQVGKQYKQYLMLEEIDFRELRQRIVLHANQSAKEGLYEDIDLFLDYMPVDTHNMVGSDVMIPCLIYVYTKAMMPEIVALLAVIQNFTLQKYADEFSFVEKTLQGLDMFIRNEMHKLDQRTERFTYVSNRLSHSQSQLLMT
jgi:hypothetical protein